MQASISLNEAIYRKLRNKQAKFELAGRVYSVARLLDFYIEFHSIVIDGCIQVARLPEKDQPMAFHRLIDHADSYKPPTYQKRGYRPSQRATITQRMMVEQHMVRSLGYHPTAKDIDYVLDMGVDGSPHFDALLAKSKHEISKGVPLDETTLVRILVAKDENRVSAEFFRALTKQLKEQNHDTDSRSSPPNDQQPGDADRRPGDGEEGPEAPDPAPLPPVR
jgi:hypothetical protein